MFEIEDLRLAMIVWLAVVLVVVAFCIAFHMIFPRTSARLKHWRRRMFLGIVRWWRGFCDDFAYDHPWFHRLRTKLNGRTTIRIRHIAA